MFGVKFVTDIHSLIISGNNNSVDNCAFTVTGIGQNALWLNGGNNSIVRNCTFNSSKLHAISIENGGNHRIENCNILNSNDIGIVIRGLGNNIVKKCNILNGNHNGIGLLGNTANNLIDSCEINNNKFAGIAFGDLDSPWSETPSINNKVKKVAKPSLNQASSQVVSVIAFPNH